MREDEILIKELNEVSDAALAAAESFCDALGKIGEIDPGTPNKEDAEEMQKYQAFMVEKDRRRNLILRRILLEYGNLLFA